jgi:hypothetical protein
MANVVRKAAVSILWRLGRRYAVPLALVALRAFLARAKKNKKI